MAEVKKFEWLNWKIIVVGVLLFVLGGAGALGYMLFTLQNGGEVKEKPSSRAVVHGPLVKGGEFVVNIADPGGRRYLKTEVHLEVKDEKAQKEIEGKLPIIQDRILSVLSSKTLADLEVYNRDNLRQELLNQINSALGENMLIQNVYFTVFVIQ